MDLRDLRYFLAVAEELSFTRAATRAGIAQPPLSQRIKQFEAELGTALFARTKRKVALTDAGKILLPMARQILNSTGVAFDTMRMVAQGRAGKVVVGAYYSAIYTVLPEIIGAFAAAHPSVDIQIREMVVEQQITSLRDGSIDVGILRLDRAEPDLKTIKLFEEDYVLAVPANHHFRRSKSVSVRAVAGEPLIVLGASVNPEFHAATNAIFAARRVSPNIFHEAASMHLMLGLVSAGLGVAIVPGSLAEIRQKHIVFRRFTEQLPRMSVHLGWHSGTLSPVIPRFVDVAKTTIGGRRWRQGDP